MSVAMDLTGNKYGRLTVINKVETGKRGQWWHCACDCGGSKTVCTGDLRAGNVTSCGRCKKTHHKNLKGQRFGMLMVIERNGSDSGRHAAWLCKCDCGNTITVSSNSLIKGNTKSCGCLCEKGSNYRHGQSRTRLYHVWTNMKYRCNNPHSRNYRNYGGRGISICEEWQTFDKFYDWAIQSGYDNEAKFGDCTIDRIDVNGNYEPDNCRWADMVTQRNNQRCSMQQPMSHTKTA